MTETQIPSIEDLFAMFDSTMHRFTDNIVNVQTTQRVRFVQEVRVISKKYDTLKNKIQEEMLYLSVMQILTRSKKLLRYNITLHLLIRQFIDVVDSMEDLNEE